VHELGTFSNTSESGNLPEILLTSVCLRIKEMVEGDKAIAEKLHYLTKNKNYQDEVFFKRNSYKISELLTVRRNLLFKFTLEGG